MKSVGSIMREQPFFPGRTSFSFFVLSSLNILKVHN